jgi:hypothetical protein
MDQRSRKNQGHINGKATEQLNSDAMKCTVIYILLLSCTFFSACKDIRSEPVTYTSNGEKLKGYMAYDNKIKGKRPGILVVHEWWGHNEL